MHVDLTPAALVELLKGPFAKCPADRGGVLLAERLVDDAINRQASERRSDREGLAWEGGFICCFQLGDLLAPLSLFLERD